SPRPLRSALFPYTTLFRSVIGDFFVGFAVGYQAEYGDFPLRQIVPGPRGLLAFAFREQRKLREDLAGHGRMDQRLAFGDGPDGRSEEHTSELQSRFDLVCR